MNREKILALVCGILLIIVIVLVLQLFSMNTGDYVVLEAVNDSGVQIVQPKFILADESGQRIQIGPSDINPLRIDNKYLNNLSSKLLLEKGKRYFVNVTGNYQGGSDYEGSATFVYSATGQLVQVHLFYHSASTELMDLLKWKDRVQKGQGNTTAGI